MVRRFVGVEIEKEDCIAPDHPALDGHFPGNPIVPGVLILEQVGLAIEELGSCVEITQLHRVKFTAPLRPSDRFRIRISETEPQRFRFECSRVDGTTVAIGDFSVTAR